MTSAVLATSKHGSTDVQADGPAIRQESLTRDLD
jgi:hypothetical protein